MSALIFLEQLSQNSTDFGNYFRVQKPEKILHLQNIATVSLP